MPELASLDRFTVPLGGQEIELQQLVHDAGGLVLLRIRVRERTRFTIFDIDPATMPNLFKGTIKDDEMAVMREAARTATREGRR